MSLVTAALGEGPSSGPDIAAGEESGEERRSLHRSVGECAGPPAIGPHSTSWIPAGVEVVNGVAPTLAR